MSLFDAVAAGSLARLQAALAEASDPDPFDAEGRTPLMRAAELGRVDLCAALLEAGADATIEDALGETAFLKAAGSGSVDAYALLVPSCRNADQLALAETVLRTVSGTQEIPRPEDVTPDSKWARRFAAAGAKLGSWFGDDAPAKRLARALRSERK